MAFVDRKTPVFLCKENNMCGIVGYIGRKSAQNIILSGLNKLEYRG